MRVARPDAVFYPTDYLINSQLKAAINACFGFVSPNAAEADISVTMKLLDLSMSTISQSSAAYHNMEHTALVTQCGLDLIAAISLELGPVDSNKLASYIAALLLHDVGYVRNICQQDDGLTQVISMDGNTIELDQYSTDAALTPYHVDRGKIFVGEKLELFPEINIEDVQRFISETTFPVPAHIQGAEKLSIDDFSACVQSADLIGQMGDPGYINKLSKLYLEFNETGAAEAMQVTCPGDLKHTYPQFFWSMVYTHIEDHIRVLERSARGKKWVTSLYKNVFTRQKSETFSLSAQILFDRLLKLLSDSENTFEIYYGLAKGFLEFYNGFIAHVWDLDEEENLLRTKRIWYLPEESDQTEAFVRATESITFEPGHGMPGRCLESAEPQWHEDFSALDVKVFPRAVLAIDVGVKAGLAIPILADSKVIAVIEIFSKEPKAPSEEDLAFMRLVTDYVSMQFNL